MLRVTFYCIIFSEMVRCLASEHSKKQKFDKQLRVTLLILLINMYCTRQHILIFQYDLDDPERGMIFVCSATHKTKVHLKQ